MNMFNQDSEFRIIQRLDRLEKKLCGIEKAILYGIGLAFIVGFSEFLVHAITKL